MKILFLTYGSYSFPSSRVRVFQYFPFLEKNGFKLKWLPFQMEYLWQLKVRKGYCNPTNFFVKVKNRLSVILLSHYNNYIYRLWSLCQVLRWASHYDVIFIQKVLLPIWMQELIYKRNNNIIFDFDDTLAHKVGGISSESKMERLISILRKSKLVIVSNKILQGEAMPYNDQIKIIPTVVDTERYKPNQEQTQKNGKVMIGWVGQPSTSRYLITVKSALEQLSEKLPQVEYHFVGAINNILNNYPAKYEPWNYETEVDTMAQFDIGIMPLPDDNFSRGKGGYKLLQYMAMGIPCVASPVGINAEIIKDGVNGFLASTEEEWKEKLSILIQNPEIRVEMGCEGRRVVEEQYSVEKMAGILVQSIRELTNQKI